ncbi:Na+/H+ antiporter NhaC [Kurthia sibirica]|uniref:Na+/H+ antiporter NhaC n=1 Tax=Kurthia sibirica TaxID=202750 RepID=A0A2U3AKA5_9BACL|nr:Na+/H+ antiporter NhaC [Kurthia sibirica]PWI24955.1 Na+/H+ antiporter NhaC [Kurthia sibirica]GEK33134.1 Na+/H+ antiporter NhaC [Kurthia sibirica]
MFRIQAKAMPSFIEALLLICVIVITMSVSISIFKSSPHIPIIISIILLLLFGLVKKISYKDLENGLVEGSKAGLGAIFIFFFIGILISALLMGGTIPTLIYVGFSTISPHFFFAIVFLISCIVGVAVGSSLTTTATVGVAFIGMASAMDISLAITAGAIVSGAFFGDKMSPLSDTTNLSSSIVGVDLFEHIKNMAWTTIPAFILSFILFAILSPSKSVDNTQKIDAFQQALLATGLIHWYAFIPLILLVMMAIKKIPAIPTLAISSAVAIILAFFMHSYTITNVFAILYDGYKSTTGFADIDQLLSRGGLTSMFSTIGLVFLALAMGGLLFTTGVIQAILLKIEHLFRSQGSAITGAASTAIGVNILIGEQYLSILLTSEAFQDQFKKVGLHPKNLARVVEDAGTVVNPLVPWSVCGIFITSVLGVSTLDYLPFAFFCLLSPILTIVFAWTGKTLTQLPSTKKA